MTDPRFFRSARRVPTHAMTHTGGIIDLAEVYGRQARPVAPFSRGEMAVGADVSPSRRARSDPTLIEVSRVAPATLELLVANEPILWSGIRWYQSMIDATRAEIYSERSRTNRAIEDFMSTGLRIDEVFFRRIPLELGMYGRSYVEYLKNTSRTEVVGFNTGDPKVMDFKREYDEYGDGVEGSRVLTDGTGLPIGYVQLIPGMTQRDGQSRFFRRNEDMRYLALMQFNPVRHGFGFAEILMQDANLKENVEQAATAQAFNAGFPKPIIEYGNNLIDPADDLKSAADALGRDISNDKFDWASHPFGLKLDFFKSEDIGQNTIEYLNFINETFAAVMGIPNVFLYQSGKDTGRLNLEALLDNMVMMFRAFQRRLELEHMVADALRINGSPHVGVTCKYGSLGLHELKIVTSAYLRVFKSQTNETKDMLLSEAEWRDRLDQMATIKDYDNVVGLKRVA